MSDPNNVEQTALAITRAVGSPTSIIVHTVLFSGTFMLAAFGYVSFDRMLLFLTTIVSLEAIYLAIFIQMTINYQGKAIASVEQDIDEIQEDVEEINEDLGEIQEDVEEISEDVDELQEDVEEISEEFEESETEDAQEEVRKQHQKKTLDTIQGDLQKLLEDIEKLKGVQR